MIWQEAKLLCYLLDSWFSFGFWYAGFGIACLLIDWMSYFVWWNSLRLIVYLSKFPICMDVSICLLIYSKNTHFKQNISQKISLFLMIDHTDTLLICSLFIYLLVCLFVQPGENIKEAWLTLLFIHILVY